MEIEPDIRMPNKAKNKRRNNGEKKTKVRNSKIAKNLKNLKIKYKKVTKTENLFSLYSSKREK